MSIHFDLYMHIEFNRMSRARCCLKLPIQKGVYIHTTSLSSAMPCGFVDLQQHGWCQSFTKDLAKDAGLKTAEVCKARRPNVALLTHRDLTKLIGRCLQLTVPNANLGSKGLYDC